MLKGFLIYGAAIATCSSMAPVAADEAARRMGNEAAAPAPEVLQALRLFLAGESRDAVRGETALKNMGPRILPQLRYWVRKVHNEAERVRLLVEGLEGRGRSAPPLESISANDFLHGKLLECRALSQKGEHRTAHDIAQALLLLDRDNPYAWELRRIVRRAKERLVSQDVLEPAIDPGKAIYEVGDRPELVFRILNRHDGEAEIFLDKGVLGEMDVVVLLSFMDGNTRQESYKLRIEVPVEVRRITIAPGKSWEHKIPLDLGSALPLAGAVARVELEGKFRPSRWKAAGNEENLAIGLSSTELWIVPPGQTPQCDRPLEKLATALVFGRAEAFFVGGQLSVWAGEEDARLNHKLIETLLESMEQLDASRRILAARFLRDATGQEFDGDASKWRTWWASIKG